MQAVVKFGNDFGELALREVPLPEIGEDDILVEVRSAGICGSDILFYSGHPLPVPTILGHEFAGVVHKVGANIVDWKIGDRIISENTGHACGKCYSCSVGNYLECEHRIAIGYGFDGGFANYVKIPGDIIKLNPNCVFKIPESISFDEAVLLEPAANAYQALLQKSSFKTGDDVVICGPGTIGLLCIQIAKAAGANKIIVLGTQRHKDGRFAMAERLGATDTVVASDEDAIAQVRSILDGEAPRIIIDCAGSPNVLKQALEMVTNGGEIVKIGFDHEPLDYDLNTLVLKGIKLIGNMGYNYISWRNCIKLMVAEKIKTDEIITHRIPLSEFKQGFEMVIDKQAIKVILNP